MLPWEISTHFFAFADMCLRDLHVALVMGFGFDVAHMFDAKEMRRLLQIFLYSLGDNKT